MIESFIHRGLKELFETGKSARIPSDLRKRIKERLDVLHAAQTMLDLQRPGGLRFHRLVPTDRYAIDVNGPWRITFGWKDGKASRVDLEQYH